MKSFEDACPDKMLDWDWDKNKIFPDSIYKSSNDIIYLKCHNCGYKWSSSAYRVAYNRSRCKICYGKNSPKIGISDLFTVRPDLKADWDWERNTIDPKYLGINSHIHAHWVCHLCGHTWSCRLDSRSRNGSGCPVCSYKGGTSCAEYLIFLILRGMGAENRKRLLGYEYDIVLGNSVIEYNGHFWHKDVELRDSVKMETAELAGYDVYSIHERDDNKFEYSVDYNVAIIPKLEQKTIEFYKEIIPLILKEWGIVGNDFVLDSDVRSLSYVELRSKLLIPDYEKSVQYALDESDWSWSDRNPSVSPENLIANNNVYVWVQCSEGHHVPMRGDTLMKFGCRICNRVHNGYVRLVDTIIIKHFQQLFREENTGEFKYGVTVDGVKYFLYSKYYEVGVIIYDNVIQVYNVGKSTYLVGEYGLERYVKSDLVCSYLDSLYRSFEELYNDIEEE